MVAKIEDDEWQEHSHFHRYNDSEQLLTGFDRPTSTTI